MRNGALSKILVVLLLLLVQVGAAAVADAGVLEDTLDNPVQTDGTTALVFSSQTSSGGSLWSADTGTYVTAPASAQSGKISASLYSSLTTTIVGPATISFYQKVDSEPINDGLSFYLDNLTTAKYKITGKVNWQQKRYALPAGTHTLIWKYSKNGGNISKGSDAAWIDKVVVSPNTALQVTAPNGKENLYSGETMTIKWNAPAAAEKYKISYSIDGGLSYISLVTDTTSPTYPYYVPAGPGFNDLTFTTIVPTPNGNKANCKVRVQAYNNANVLVGSDVSDIPFTITVLQLTSPNGGETLSARTTPVYPISFTIYGQQNAANATVSYSTDGGVTWPLINSLSGGLTPGDHTVDWKVPALTTQKNTKVKVVLKSATGVVLGTDVSNANFTILAVYSMSGKVSYRGAGLSGVTVNVTGADTASALTDASGNYKVTGLLNGAYTLTPDLTGYDFTPITIDKTIAGANITGINFSSGMKASSLNSTYAYVGQTSGFYEYGSGPVYTASMVSTATGTIAFDGSGGCSITHTDMGYDMLHETNTLSPSPSNGSGQDACTYVLGPDGTLAVSVGGNVAFTATVGADGSTILSGGPYINGSLRGSDQMALIKTGSGFNASSLNGTYAYVGQTSGFYEYGSGPVYTASMVSTATGTITFNGSGGCSITHTDMGYDMLHETNTLSPSPSNAAGRNACTYTVAANGALTVKIGTSVAFKGTIGTDSTTILSGGPYISGKVRASDQMILIK
jgi:hypothetical protein